MFVKLFLGAGMLDFLKVLSYFNLKSKLEKYYGIPNSQMH